MLTKYAAKSQCISFETPFLISFEGLALVVLRLKSTSSVYPFKRLRLLGKYELKRTII